MRDDIEELDIVVNKFTEESVKDFRRKVLRLSAMDPSMPIIITIDSYGGHLHSFNTMLSIMRSVPNTFITLVQGKAMSAGSALLAAGDVRFCDPDAVIMIHEASGGAVGHADDIKSDAKEHDRANKQFMEFLAKRCGKTFEELKRLIIANEGRDLYLTPEQAKSFGIIDFIGLPVVRSSISHSIECLPKKRTIQIEDKTDQIKPIKKIARQPKTESKKKTKKK